MGDDAGMEPERPQRLRSTRRLALNVVGVAWVVAAVVLASAFWPDDGASVAARFPSAILAVLCLLAATVIFAGPSDQ